MCMYVCQCVAVTHVLYIILVYVVSMYVCRPHGKKGGS